MSETLFVNLALTVRVLIVGGFLLFLPRIIRKGLLFGVYVGEEVAVSSDGMRIVRSWRQGCVFVMALSLVIGYGISLTGRPVTGNLTGTAVLLCSALALYGYIYTKARKLVLPPATRQASKAVASLEMRNPKLAAYAKLALAVCLVTSITTATYSAFSFQNIPSGVPAPFDKSLIAFVFFPGLNLVISPFLALLALLTANAKLALRDGSDSHSLQAQNDFRALIVRLISWLALFICAFLTLLSVQIIRFRMAEIESIGTGVWWLGGALVVFMAAFLFRVIKGHGQGGSLREFGSAQTPLTGSLADNAHWVLGLFYFDKNDPSMMIEKRFGFGYGLNYGNRKAILILVTFMVLIVCLAAIAMIAYTN